MDTTQLKPIIEAMIFVSEKPLSENEIAAALSIEGVDKSAVRECIAEMEKSWNEDATRGIALSSVAGGYQFRTKETHAEWIKKLNVPKPVKLSGPALETLAIIAYRQPIVRSEIERIRGVDSGAVLKTLLDRRLLRIVGRQDEPGQPLLYGTTKDFLEIFNLKALGELPTLKDIEDLMRERRAVTTDTRPLTLENIGAEEEPTEVIDGADAEEDTEAFPRVSAEEEPELVDVEDEEAISALEKSLKDLRHLERNIFPREAHTQEEGLQEIANDAAAVKTISEEIERLSKVAEAGAADGAETDADPENAPASDDSPF